MRTAAPVASMFLAAALALAVAWQGVNLWRQPRPVAIPMMTSPADIGDLAVPSGAAPANKDSASSPPAPVASTTIDAAPPSVVNPGPPPVAAPASQSVAAGTESPNAPATAQVDETALRYFARQGDTRRLNAEIARLRSLYPDWTPPQDPLKPAPVVDPQLDRMWQLYAQGQFEAVREAIAARQSAEAGWIAPKDLLDRLAIAEARDRLVNASDAKQYGMVIQIAATTPSLRTCGDVDVLWRVAEAFVRTDRQPRAADAYRYILTNCTNGPERIATMQKAATLLPRQDLAPLFELAHPGAEADELRSIRDDFARRAVSAGGADAKADVSEEDVATVERLADAGHSAGDPMLLGWYFLRRDDATQAERWFRISYDRQNAAVSAQGLALALLELKKPAEAEALLARWRDTNDDAGKVYMAVATKLLTQEPPPVIASDVIARIVEAVAKRHNPAGAQELGWYSRAYSQDETAAQWFAAALAWKPDDEPSAFGLAVVDSALNRRDALKALTRVWRERSPRILALVDPAAARVVAAAASSQGQAGATEAAPQQDAAAAGYAPAPAAGAPPSTTMRLTGERAAVRQTALAARAECARGGAETTQGWCLMQLDRPTEAAAAFRALLATGSAKERSDAAYGLSLAYLRLGLTAEADTAASAAPQTDERVSQIRLAILAQRIQAAYNAGDYAGALIDLDARARVAPELTYMMGLRGWSYYHLQRYEEAARLFEALAASGDEDAVSALDLARAKLGGPANADVK
jgi:cellulose synthase operon protein C